MVLSIARFVGKVAVVTGASSGIGAAIVDLLVENGLIVVGVARRVDRIEEKSKQLSGKKGKLFAIKADMAKEDDILAGFKLIETNIGPIHILINNAGSVREGPLSSGKSADWKHVFDLNVIGLCIATREAFKIMRDNNINGHIIHINSIAGHLVPPAPNMNVYSASKYAVTALTETLRQELNTLGSKIKVTSVSPGLVVSELTLLSQEISEERREMMRKRPILNPEDIADGVLYVLSTPEHVQVHELTIKPVGEPY